MMSTKNLSGVFSVKVLVFAALLTAGALPLNAQTEHNSRLTGVIYAADGAVIVGATVTAAAGGKVFSATTNDEGIYVLTLPFNQYDKKPKFKSARFEITVERAGFIRSETKGFVFVPSYSGSMCLDIALDVGSIVDYHE